MQAVWDQLTEAYQYLDCGNYHDVPPSFGAVKMYQDYINLCIAFMFNKPDRQTRLDTVKVSKSLSWSLVEYLVFSCIYDAEIGEEAPFEEKKRIIESMDEKINELATILDARNSQEASCRIGLAKGSKVL